MFDARKAMELQKLHGVENFKKLTIPQMLERTKLIQILESAESAFYWNSSDKGFIEKIADHLIANGVTTPVRCKDCKHYKPQVKGAHIKGHTPYCCRSATVKVDSGDYCSYGERKDNGN